MLPVGVVTPATWKNIPSGRDGELSTNMIGCDIAMRAFVLSRTSARTYVKEPLSGIDFVTS